MWAVDVERCYKRNWSHCCGWELNFQDASLESTETESSCKHEWRHMLGPRGRRERTLYRVLSAERLPFKKLRGFADLCSGYLQQRRLQPKRLYAQRMFWRFRRRNPHLFTRHWKGAELVRETEETEHMDKERLRLGLQVLCLSMRKRPFEKGSRVSTA